MGALSRVAVLESPADPRMCGPVVSRLGTTAEAAETGARDASVAHRVPSPIPMCSGCYRLHLRLHAAPVAYSCLDADVTVVNSFCPCLSWPALVFDVCAIAPHLQLVAQFIPEFFGEHAGTSSDAAIMRQVDLCEDDGHRVRLCAMSGLPKLCGSDADSVSRIANMLGQMLLNESAEEQETVRAGLMDLIKRNVQGSLTALLTYVPCQSRHPVPVVPAHRGYGHAVTSLATTRPSVPR